LRNAAINGKTAEVDRLIKSGVNKEAKDDEVRGFGRSLLSHFKCFLWLPLVIIAVESALAIAPVGVDLIAIFYIRTQYPD
jgi:hypothetical protein